LLISTACCDAGKRVRLNANVIAEGLNMRSQGYDNLVTKSAWN
jgi:hypothetical protein